MTQEQNPETPLSEQTRLQELLLAALRTEAERLSQAAGALTQSLADEQRPAAADSQERAEGSAAETRGSEGCAPSSPPSEQ